MNKDKLLRLILDDSTLKKKFWPDTKADEWNMDTISKSNNQYHKVLFELLNEKSTAANQKALFNRIQNIFGI